MGLQADDDDSSDIRATARSFLAIVLTRPTTTSERPPGTPDGRSDRVANASTIAPVDHGRRRTSLHSGSGFIQVQLLLWSIEAYGVLRHMEY